MKVYISIKDYDNQAFQYFPLYRHLLLSFYWITKKGVQGHIRKLSTRKEKRTVKDLIEGKHTLRDI